MNHDHIGTGPKHPIPERFASNDAMLAALNAIHRDFYKADPQGELRPCVFVVCENGDILPIVTGFAGSDSKNAFVEFLKQSFAKWKVIRYAFISEAWAATSTTAMPIPRPSQREDRVEILITQVEDKDGSVTDCFEIVRDWESGAVVELKPYSSSKTATFGGRFSGLLRKE